MSRRHCFLAAAVTAILTLPAAAADLTVVVTNIEKAEGALMIAVFDSESAFDDGGEPVDAKAVPVSDLEATVVFDDMAPGDYAIKMYHDANGNGEMDTNLMGLPSESYGFSGNKGRFGPPPYADAKFTVGDEQDNTVTIKLR